ncbi:histidine kinase [Actinoplanes sp. OR16]|uniref:ATP-binding protein n=1 Tax=Actinoplanes sp. OR16 TaxID=946334 RepID=UPI000F6BF959|nr:ATP-binding protein [Actinoplanes sp. OR16]BBH68488.1 histidine kinase [Actinoplanes sp. OR16]
MDGEESLFAQILDAAPDATVCVDRAGLIVFVNAQALRLFGYRREELLSRPIEVLVPDDVVTPHLRLREKYFAAVTHRAMGTGDPLYAKRHDGSVFPAEISLSGLQTGAGLLVSAAVRDITDRLRAAEERARLREEAERAELQNQLQRTQRIESLGQLAGGIAHDFNNLIAVISNYAEFIADTAADHLPASDDEPHDERHTWIAEIHRDGQQIQRAAQRGAALTRQLLAFARQDVTRPRVIELGDVVHQVEDMLRRSLGEHILLTTRCAADCGPVLFDPGQMEQVLVNLAVNARDAMPGGGVLTIDTARVLVDADYLASGPAIAAGEYSRVRVSDTGTGMPREVIDRVFEPFFTTKAPGEGTGLGLAMVYGLVTAAGGSVGITSEPGMGTTITIMLPVTDRDSAPAAPATGPQHDVRGQGQTILLVEDEPALRQVCRRLLSGNGYHVLVPEDSTAAAELARCRGTGIDLVLTDVIMPRLLGTDLAAQVTAAHPNIRVLFMSGYATPVLAAQGTLAPGVNLLEKPFTSGELLAAVHDALHEAR